MTESTRERKELFRLKKEKVSSKEQPSNRNSGVNKRIHFKMGLDNFMTGVI